MFPLLFPVSSFLFPLLSPVSSLLSPVPSLLSPLFCPLSPLSSLLFPLSCLLSPLLSSPEVSLLSGEETDTNSDLMLAQLLQMQYDRECDTQLRREERKYNGESKGGDPHKTLF